MSKHLHQTIVFTPTLERRLAAEADGHSYIAYFQAEGATLTHRSGIAPNPDPVQEMIAMDIVERFNRDIGFGGTWLVQLTHMPAMLVNVLLEPPTYQCMRFLWMDEDGDVQIPIECWDSIPDIAQAGMVHFMEQAYQAYQTWQKQRDVLDLRPHETKRVARGEAYTPVPVDIDILH